MLSIGFLAESVALRYDEIFANKQIYFLLARVSMAGNSFTTNLVIFRWLMATSGCLLLLDCIYSFLTIYKESKILHAIVSRYISYVVCWSLSSFLLIRCCCFLLVCPSVQSILTFYSKTTEPTLTNLVTKPLGLLASKIVLYSFTFNVR